MAYRTEQESFWAGDFGDEYIERNTTELIYKNIALFAEVLKSTGGVKSCIEFGSNIGLNLKAIQCLIPNIECSAIEINHKAAAKLVENVKNIKVFEQSILDYKAGEKYDFVLIKGVLIHTNPDELEKVYQKLYDSSQRYICMIEYYNPTPVMIEYRGNKNKLFKRDFCGEFMDKFRDINLVDYGFKYHRDNNFPQDDLTWFLLEKQ